MARTPITFEEEVTAAVIEWYKVLGQPVPPADLEACKGLDLAREKEAQQITAQTTAKPEYGTPEFWKDWWAKKKAKEAATKSAPTSQKS